MSETKEYYAKRSYMEHSKHANMILQRASANTLLAIERQRKLALGNLMRQKRLVQNELCSHRDAPVEPKSSPLSRQETRSATLRREAIVLGGNAPGSLSVHHFGQQINRAEPLLKPAIKNDECDSSDDEDASESSASPVKMVDLLFEGLTISRRTQESLKRNEEVQEEWEHSADHSMGNIHHDESDEIPRSASKLKTSKIVSFQESRNRTYLYCDNPREHTHKPHTSQAVTVTPAKHQLGDRHRLVKSAYLPRSIGGMYTSPLSRNRVTISAPLDRRFPFDVRHRPIVPPSSPWAVHKYGRLYRRTSLTRPQTNPESKQAKPATSSYPKPAKSKFIPWAAYKFPSVEQNQTNDSQTCEKHILRNQSLVNKPGKDETVLYLRKVDQSRENKTVLVKVERFLERNWSRGVGRKKVEDGDSSGSDIIDEEEDQMIQMSRRGHISYD